MALAAPRVIAFDAFGTLFDVDGVSAACEAAFPGHGAALGRAWRDKQLRYTWLRSLMGRYADFERVTEDALAAACVDLGLDPEVARRHGLAEEYRRLPPYRDVPGGLRALERAGCRLAILSNGTPAQLAALVDAARLGVALELLSVDAVRTYKPDPRVYRLVTDRFGAAPADVLFVSSNAWDVAGAASFGLPSAWLNRAGGPFEVLGPKPPWTLRSLADLPDRIAREA
jgi:2-haloacid dehalogenase